MNKKKVLRIVHTLNPAEGGIATSVIENSISLLKKNIDIEILTSDNENSTFQKSNKIKIINMGPGIGKFGFSIKLTIWLFKNRYNYDTFIVDGVWTYGSLISRLLLKKNILFLFMVLLIHILRIIFQKELRNNCIGFYLEKKI